MTELVDEVIYRPSAWQEQFHALPHHEALGAGAAGPGKTLCLLMDPLAMIHIENQRAFDKAHPYYFGPGNSTGWCLHLRRIGSTLDQTIARAHRIFPQIDENVKWHAQDKRFVFSSGLRFEFGHCRNREDWEQYLSNEYQHIAFDELVQFEEEQYSQIKTRLRSSDPILSKMLKVRSMSNPVMKREAGENFFVSDPQWVRRYFVEQAPEGGVTLRKKLKRSDGTVFYRDRIYLPARLSDNPNAEFRRQYEEELLDAPPHIRQALLYGSWNVMVGGFYTDAWNPLIHTCKPFAIPKHWSVFRSMDWGHKVPGCVHWWAIDDDNTLWGIRELTFKGKTETEVVQLIKVIEEELGFWKFGRSQLTGPADTQIWGADKGGKTAAQVFSEKGVLWTKADKKSRSGNARRILGRLMDHGSGTTPPGLVLFTNCKQLIRTLPGIGSVPGDPDTPQDGGEDHWADSLNYACAYASRGKIGTDKHAMEDREKEDNVIPMRGRGQYGYGSVVC